MYEGFSTFLRRVWRHTVLSRFSMKRSFHTEVRKQIATAVQEAEKLCGGEIRLVVEGGLTLGELIYSQEVRQRAEGYFSDLRIWDTAQNNGLLLYILFADSAIEIVADRGLTGRIFFEHRTMEMSEVFELVCERLARCCKEGRHSAGISEAVLSLGKAIGMLYPRSPDDKDELSNETVFV